MVINRGSHEEIDVFPGYPLDNKLSGNVVDLCPVGALGDKDFLYQQRVWFMKQHAGVCTGCSTGCSITVEENQDTVYRLKPRENPHVNQWWMCDEGRYGYHHVHSDQPVDERRSAATDGELVDARMVAGAAARSTSDCAQAGRLAAVLSPHLTVEEAYLLAKYVRGDRSRRRCSRWGRCRSWARTRRSRTASRSAPKSARIAAASKRSSRTSCGRVATFDDLLAERRSRRDRGACGSAADTSTTGSTRPTAERFAGVELLVVQDLFASPLWERATYQLARRGVCRARRLVRESRRSAAKRRLGHSSAGRRAGRRRACIGELLAMPGLYKPAACWTKWPREIALLLAARPSRSARWESI